MTTKSVHLETQVHKKAKIRAVKKDTTIEKVVNEILKKALKEELIMDKKVE